MIDITPTNMAFNLLIFVLATFLGLELVRHVSRLLHTPLMALTNAISSISFIAALILLVNPKNDLILTIAIIAVALAATNIISGFMIMERILRKFKRREDSK